MLESTWVRWLLGGMCLHRQQNHNIQRKVVPLSGGIGSFKLHHGDEEDALNYGASVRVKKLDIEKCLLKDVKWFLPMITSFVVQGH